MCGWRRWSGRRNWRRRPGHAEIQDGRLSRSVAANKLKSIARRIAKLEAALSPRREREDGRGRRRGARSHPSLQVLLGNLRYLPEDYQGERHIEIARCLPDHHGWKWVEFAEVPGPPPNLRPEGRPGLHVVFVPPKFTAAMALSKRVSLLLATRAEGAQP